MIENSQIVNMKLIDTMKPLFMDPKHGFDLYGAVAACACVIATYAGKTKDFKSEAMRMIKIAQVGAEAHMGGIPVPHPDEVLPIDDDLLSEAASKILPEIEKYVEEHTFLRKQEPVALVEKSDTNGYMIAAQTFAAYFGSLMGTSCDQIPASVMLQTLIRLILRYRDMSCA